MPSYCLFWKEMSWSGYTGGASLLFKTRQPEFYEKRENSVRSAKMTKHTAGLILFWLKFYHITCENTSVLIMAVNTGIFKMDQHVKVWLVVNEDNCILCRFGVVSQMHGQLRHTNFFRHFGLLMTRIWHQFQIDINFKLFCCIYALWIMILNALDAHVF